VESGSERRPHLPCPTVAFGGDYVRRLERLTLRLAAARERREGAGSAALAGGGDEFVGYRPYRPGEDLRRLDWDLFARLDRPYVRLTRREAAEHWSVFVDASGSMGIGPPGKLQAAAELAGAFTCVALRSGATVEVVASGEGGPRSARARRLTDLPALLGFLEALVAGGAAGLGTLVTQSRPPAECGRMVLLGDLLDLEPAQTVGLRGVGRELVCVQILAPLELAPPSSGFVEWHDPEGTGRLSRALDDATVGAYERRLEERLEAWSALAARASIAYAVHGSDRPFEDVVRSLFEA